MGRLGQAGPEDMALRQRMMAAEAKRGQGPQFQGQGRPGWQSVGPKEAISRLGPGSRGQNRAMPGAAGGPNPNAAMQIGNAMGGQTPLGPRPGTGAQGGYAAYQAGPMGMLEQQNPGMVKPAEQTQWMPRR
jgi:hypothetical protein